MMPCVHPREEIVRKADISLSEHILDWMREDSTKELTDAEYISIVGNELGNAIARRAKFMIRMERHGNTDIPGGWE